MSRTAAPLASAAHVHAHGDGHDHAHGHGHGHPHGHVHGHPHDHGHHPAHGHPPGTAPATDADTALPFSLLMAGAGQRLLGVAGLLLLLWLAVAWALGEPA